MLVHYYFFDVEVVCLLSASLRTFTNFIFSYNNNNNNNLSSVFTVLAATFPVTLGCHVGSPSPFDI